jgi:hypothetical protein
MLPLGDFNELLKKLAVAPVDVKFALLLEELKGPNFVVMSLLHRVLHLFRLFHRLSDNVFLDGVELSQVDVHAPSRLSVIMITSCDRPPP